MAGVAFEKRERRHFAVLSRRRRARQAVEKLGDEPLGQHYLRQGRPHDILGEAAGFSDGVAQQQRVEEPLNLTRVALGAIRQNRADLLAERNGRLQLGG